MTYDELVTKPDEDEFRYALPRDDKHMDGRDFRIKGVLPDRSVIISDGERSAAYETKNPLDGELEIVPGYIEAGWYCEANEVKLTNGKRTELYWPKGLEEFRRAREEADLHAAVHGAATRAST